MSLEDDLAHTQRAVSRLRARRPDNLEDYFHDAICRALSRGIPLGNQGYLYKSVYNRIACGQEGRPVVPLEESIAEDGQQENTDLKLDIQRGLAALTPLQYKYVYDKFFEGFTEREIAMLYDTTHQSVDRVIQRALEMMRKVLRDQT